MSPGVSLPLPRSVGHEAHTRFRSPPPPLASTLRDKAPSATLVINERSNALIRQGRTVSKLGLGQSPFPVPLSVVDALIRNAHQKDYLPVRGLPELREAVAQYHQRFGVCGRSERDVLIGPGSKELLFMLQMAFEGELIIPNPAWVSYAPQARILGRNVRFVETEFEAGFKLTAAALDRTLASLPPAPRVLILNSPSNPTGGVHDRSELEAIVSVARKYDLVVLSDEIYAELQFEGVHTSLAELYPEATIVSSGLSKWCGAGGWRIGSFLFPPELRWLLDGMCIVASETYTSVSAPIQHAAVDAYAIGPDTELYLSDSRRVLAALARWSHATLERAGLRATIPAGGFYSMVSFAPFTDRLHAREIRSSRELCDAVLEEAGVAILPGADFGRPEAELTARLAFVDFDGELALRELGRSPEHTEIGDQFLRRCCPSVVRGVEAIASWAAGA